MENSSIKTHKTDKEPLFSAEKTELEKLNCDNLSSNTLID